MSRYLRALSEREFRYLFAGQAASVVGDRLVVVALALFVTQRTGSATDLGLVLAAQSAPLVTLLLFGGVWADRLPRHRIMIATDVIRGCLHALLAALIFTGAIRVWQIVVIEIGFGAAQAFFQPAYTGLLPQTVPDELIQDARALTESVANLAFLLGPALATVIVLGIGAGTAFAVDAATFGFSAVMLARLRLPAAPAPAPTGYERSLLDDLGRGWREVRSRTWVWVTIAAFTGVILCLYAQWYTLAPVIARDAYGDVGVFGVLEAAAGVGAVGAALIGLRWRPAHPLRTGLLLVLAWPVQTAVFAAHVPLGVVLPCSFATGFGFALLMVWWETALAHHIPRYALSRVSAYDWMGSLALVPVGYVIAGPLADAFGARTVLGVGSALGFVLLALALVPRQTRELGGLPAPRPGPASGPVPARGSVPAPTAPTRAL
jgi:MFS family permease